MHETLMNLMFSVFYRKKTGKGEDDHNEEDDGFDDA